MENEGVISTGPVLVVNGRYQGRLGYYKEGYGNFEYGAHRVMVTFGPEKEDVCVVLKKHLFNVGGVPARFVEEVVLKPGYYYRPLPKPY